MAITTTHQKIVFICDNCREDFDSEIEPGAPNAFRQAIIQAHQAGWKTIHIKGADTWLHYCEACKS